MTVKILEQNFPSLAKFKDLKLKLSEICTVRDFTKGDVVLKNGDYVKIIPLLVSGLVKVYKEDDVDGEVLLYYIEKGESCVMSMTALIKNEKVEVKGVVEEDAQVLMIPAAEAKAISQEYPEWNEFIYDLFKNKYNELLSVISTLTFSNKDVRLLNYLKKQSELKKSKIITKTHQEIAIDLGSSREVISRLLKKMENNHEVKLSQGKIKMLS